jgi:FKBP-type peptidyl-prolyl cis-trans isomerase
VEPAEMKKYLIPALALGAIIAVVGLIAMGNASPNSAKAGSASEASMKALIEPGADTSMDGMSDTMPANTMGPEWLTLAGGLRICDVKAGTGETVSAGQMVAVHYTGWRTDGYSFDGSKKTGQFAKFSLNGVIPGWRDGIPGMKVGGIRRLYVPSAMGYGSQGMGRDIPPDADLIFEVKLLGYR